MLRRGAGRRLARGALLLPVRLQALHLALHHLHLLPQHLRGHRQSSISSYIATHHSHPIKQRTTAELENSRLIGTNLTALICTVEI